MSDSLKTRVGRVIAGGAHAILDRIEDKAPEAMMEQSIRDADAVIDDVRHELGVVSANRHLSQQRHTGLNAQHTALTAQSHEALASGREDLAKAAVARLLDIEAQLPVLEATLGDYLLQEGELQGYVAALLAKKREMQEALSQFRKSRAAGSPAVPVAAGAGTSAARRIDAVTEAFDRVFERQTGLDGLTRSDGLEQAVQLQALDELVRENRIAERIAQLKAGKA
ncbi:MAG: PspA/IM30 family protein [Proteobacteria bacterium]|nr:PspA/IM30 family protein [Pseudomonadota bacterium]